MVQERGELLQQLFDLINCGVILTDSDFSILHANRKAEAMFGAGRGGLVGRAMEEFFMPEDRTILYSNVVSLTMKRGEFEGELMLRRLDSTTFIGLMTTSRLPHRVPGDAEVVISVHDVSRLKSLERTLRESERMAFLGNMLDDISHQIRNPILTIGGFSRRLSSSDKTASKYVDVILKECGRLEQLLSTLQEFIHLPKPSPRRVSVNEFMGSLVPRLREVARDTATELVLLDHGEEIGGHGLMVDQRLVFNAVEAVFLNACESYEALEREKRVVVRLTAGEEWPLGCRLMVEDQGCGIGRHLLPHVFDPFFSTKTGHVGMGLTMAQRICREQEVGLDLRSELGKGTTVEFGLPAERRRRIRAEIVENR